MNYLPNHIIAGVLSFFPENIYLTTDRIKIHKTIFKLQQKKKYSLLKPFVFSTKRISPKSQVLEKTLARLLLARIISFDDPDFLRFEIRPSARKYIKGNILGKFTKNEQTQLKAIAEELSNECGEKSEA